MARYVVIVVSGVVVAYLIASRRQVCVRGPVVFSRYFVAPPDSESPVDEHGWLHTGDIGAWNANGTLTIIDRRKNIFKLAQGELRSVVVVGYGCVVLCLRFFLYLGMPLQICGARED